jgi:hypothetical protein
MYGKWRLSVIGVLVERDPHTQSSQTTAIIHGPSVVSEQMQSLQHKISNVASGAQVKEEELAMRTEHRDNIPMQTSEQAVREAPTNSEEEDYMSEEEDDYEEEEEEAVEVVVRRYDLALLQMREFFRRVYGEGAGEAAQARPASEWKFDTAWLESICAIEDIHPSLLGGVGFQG